MITIKLGKFKFRLPTFGTSGLGVTAQVLIVSGILLFLIAMALAFYQERQLRQIIVENRINQISSQASAIATYIKSTPQVLYAPERAQELNARLARVALEYDLDEFFVVDKNRRIVAHNHNHEIGTFYKNPDVRKAMKEERVVIEYETHRERGKEIPRLDVAFPLYLGDRLVGAMEAEVSLESLNWSTFNLQKKLFLPVLILIAALLVFLFGFLRANVINPVRELAFTAEKISEGDLTARSTVSRKDEIGELANIFNRMADQIAERVDVAEKLAVIDGLTGLYNHRYLHDRLEEELRRAERFGHVVTLLFADIDDFKKFNDFNGHTYGDAALRDIATLIKASIRLIDIPARYGGEEFAIILPETDKKQAGEIAERICASVAGHQFSTRYNIAHPLTISIGIASFPEDATSPRSLIAKADFAMYEAKLKGKNQYCYFSGDEPARILHKIPTIDESDIQAIKEEMLVNSAFSLAVAVDMRDRYTRRHSEFVALYATAIARKLKLPSEQVKQISLAGLLHDVGKIGVPDSILKKKGKLNERERKIMERHPILGAEIVRNIGSLSNIVRAITHHHERYDGSGYPDGLKGEEIPLESRILAVVDACHAMISDRPYRDLMSREEAVEEIKKCAGKQFDPQVVKAFTKVYTVEESVTNLLEKQQKPSTFISDFSL
jgi:diguanylate cyclase (GGDEF)-like protein/putative nucleotidyltransferase with HDIG domain